MNRLYTTSLVLEPCVPADCADFMALERDPEVMRFLNGGQPVDHTQPDPDASFLMPRGTEQHVWTARRIDGASFVGWFCLWPEDETLAELGYRLKREAWGQGLGSEGAQALVDWGFQSAGYERITACTASTNLASRRVMEKLGMTYMRTVSAEGPAAITDGDEVWYEVTRAMWEGRGAR